MKDHPKTNEQLVQELAEMRHRVAELEASETRRKRAEEALWASEERCRALFEESRDAIYLTTREGKVIDGNQAAFDLFGCTKEEFMMLDALETYVDPDARRRFQSEIEQKGSVRDFEVKLRRKDGTEMDCLVTSTLRRTEDGTPQGYRGIIRDITEQKQAEEALRESKRRYRLLAENVTDVFWTMDMNLHFTYFSPSVTRMLGYSVERAVAKTLEEILTPASVRIAMKGFEEELAKEKMEKKDLLRSGTLELELVCKDGRTIWTEVKMTFLRDPEGHAVGILGVARNITDRKEAKEALLFAAQEWRETFDAISDIVFLLDLQGRVLRCNKAMTNFLGKPFSEIIGRPCWELSHGTSEPIVGCPFARMRQTRRSETSVSSLGDRWFNVLVDPRLDRDGNLIGAVHIMSDITDRKRAEEALAEERNLLRTLIDNLPDYIFVKDSENRFITTNAAHLEVLGARTLEEVIGKTDFDFFPQEIAEEYYAGEQEVIRSGQPMVNREEFTRDPHGVAHWLLTTKVPLHDSSGSVVSLVGICRDITEHKRVEAALVHERYLLHSLMDNLPDSIYFKDTGSRFTRINKALAERFGLSDPSQALGKTDFHFFTEEHARQAFKDEQEIMRSGQPLVGKEEKETRPDGRVRWVSTTKLPLRDKDGKIIGTFGVSRDIIDRRKVEEAPEDGDGKYRNVIEDVKPEEKREGGASWRSLRGKG